MRLTIEGSVGKQEILESLAQLLNALENAGADDFNGVSIQFSTCVEGQKVLPLVNGKEMSVSLKSSGKHIKQFGNGTYAMDGVSFTKNVPSSDMDMDSNMDLGGELTLKSMVDLYTENKERLIKNKADHKKIAQCDEKIMATDFESRLRNLLGLTFDEFLQKHSSSGWIRTSKGIKKYIPDSHYLKVYRISMKIEGSHNKMVYLYTTKGELVYQSMTSYN